MNLDGRVAIVTGGRRGIGRAIANLLAVQGADIVLGDREPDEAEIAAKEIAEATGRRAQGCFVDVSDVDSTQAMVRCALEDFGRVDILVNNAGITRDTLILRMSEQDWDFVLSVNLKGSFNFTKAVCRPMMKQRKGAIVNIASIIGIIGNVGQANYSASKAGVIGLTKTSARELAKRNIRVNAVAPGFIKTAMTDKIPEDIAGKMKEQIPLGCFGEPASVADAAMFLASEYSSYITGQVLVVDGGMVM